MNICRRMMLVGFGALLLSACGDGAPVIGRDLPRSWSDRTPYFDNRVKQRFPIGSDETKLLEELRNERFSISDIHDPSRHFTFSALYEHSDLACRETWMISWRADHGKVANIQGNYRQVCL
jgi:hypothetical protein